MNVEQEIYTCKPTEMSEGVAALTDERILSCVLMVGKYSAQYSKSFLLLKSNKTISHCSLCLTQFETLDGQIFSIPFVDTLFSNDVSKLENILGIGCNNFCCVNHFHFIL